MSSAAASPSAASNSGSTITTRPGTDGGNRTTQQGRVAIGTGNVAPREVEAANDAEEEGTAVQATSQMWKSCEAKKQDIQRHIAGTVKNFIRTTLFAKYKFITDPSYELRYCTDSPKSICQTVMAGCHIPVTDAMWWNVASRVVDREIKRFCNTKADGAKNIFKGKLNIKG